MRAVAAILSLPFLVAAAIGSGWEANLITSTKERVLCVIIGVLFAAMGALGTRFRSVYKVTAVIVLNTVLLVVSLELCIAMVDEINREEDDDAEGVNPVLMSRPLQQRHTMEFAKSEPHQYEPFILWRTVPYKGDTINVSERGIRDTPGSKCVEGAYTVFTLGGSAMWGAGAPDSETIPAFLASILREYTGKPVCVVNYAQNGYVISQNVAQLVNLVLSGERPDLVISYDGFNEVYVAYEQGHADRHFFYEEARKFFEPAPSTWYQSLSLYWAAHPEPSPAQRWQDYTTMGRNADELSEDVANRYFNSYAVVEALAKAWRFDCALFIQPVISVSKKHLTDGEGVVKRDMSEPLARLTELIYRQLKAGVRDRGRLFDLTNVFDEADGEIWLDSVHVPGAGNRIVAERMATILANEGILTPPGNTSDDLQRSQPSTTRIQ